MRKLVMIMFMFSFMALAQSETNPTAQSNISQEERECIQQIYNNPDAIKYLIRTMMSDKESMQRVHNSLRNDPEMREMIQQLRGMMEGEMHHNRQQKMQDQQHKRE